MTRDEAKKIVDAITAVQDAGYGSVEIVVKDGKIVYIVKELREHIEHIEHIS